MSSRPPWEVDDTDEAPPWEFDDTESAAPTPKPPRTQRPLSWWERFQQGTSGFAYDLAQGAKGLVKETPLMLARQAKFLPEDLASGAINLAADATGLSRNPKIASALIRQDEERNKERQRIEQMLGEGRDAGTGEKVGRTLARAVPGIATGIATGGASVPVQMAVQGGQQAIQSLSEGASPTAAAFSGGLASAGAPIAAGISALKAPFKKAVDQGAKAAFGRLGIEPPASAISNSPTAQYLEGIASRFIGGQGAADRARNAAQGILDAGRRTVTDAGDPTALLAGRNIAESVFDAEGQAAGRQAMLEAEKRLFDTAQQQGREQIIGSISDPALAREASRLMGEGLRSVRGVFDQVKNALWSKVDLRGVQAPMEGVVGRLDDLIARGDMSPNDLAALRRLRDSVAPQLDSVAAEALEQYPDLAGTILKNAQTTPRQGNEILSQIRGLREGAGYGQAGPVFGNKSLKRKLAGEMTDELQESITDPDMAARFQAARAFYERGIQPFKSQWGKRIATMSQNKQTSQIADALVNPRTPVEQVPEMFATLGNDAKQAVQANVIERILAKRDPAAVQKAMAQWGDKLDSILTPDQIDGLKKLAQPTAEFPMPTAPVQGPQTAAEMLSGRWGKPIKGAFTEGSPEKVVPTVVRPNSSVQEVQAALKAAGSKDAQDEVRANVIQRVLGIGSEQDLAKLTPEALRRSIAEWNKGGKLSQILTKDQVQAIRDLEKVARAFGDNTKRITGGSQTAFLLQLARLPERAAQNPLKALRSLGLEVAVAKALSGKGGQQWLTEGFAPGMAEGLARGGSAALSRLPSEYQMDSRRRELEALLAGR